MDLTATRLPEQAEEGVMGDSYVLEGGDDGRWGILRKAQWPSFCSTSKSSSVTRL